MNPIDRSEGDSNLSPRRRQWHERHADQLHFSRENRSGRGHIGERAGHIRSRVQLERRERCPCSNWRRRGPRQDGTLPHGYRARHFEVVARRGLTAEADRDVIGRARPRAIEGEAWVDLDCGDRRIGRNVGE